MRKRKTTGGIPTIKIMHVIKRIENGGNINFVTTSAILIQILCTSLTHTLENGAPHFTIDRAIEESELSSLYSFCKSVEPLPLALQIIKQYIDTYIYSEEGKNKFLNVYLPSGDEIQTFMEEQIRKGPLTGEQRSFLFPGSLSNEEKPSSKDSLGEINSLFMTMLDMGEDEKKRFLEILFGMSIPVIVWFDAQSGNVYDFKVKEILENRLFRHVSNLLERGKILKESFENWEIEWGKGVILQLIEEFKNLYLGDEAVNNAVEKTYIHLRGTKTSPFLGEQKEEKVKNKSIEEEISNVIRQINVLKIDSHPLKKEKLSGKNLMEEFIDACKEEKSNKTIINTILDLLRVQNDHKILDELAIRCFSHFTLDNHEGKIVFLLGLLIRQKLLPECKFQKNINVESKLVGTKPSLFVCLSSIYAIANSPVISIDMLAAYLTKLDELLAENSRADDLLDEFYAAGGPECPVYVLNTLSTRFYNERIPKDEQGTFSPRSRGFPG
ncbi:hypothetical protein [Coxiella burnetii]|uniref:hypothetical protein n=2 Tax=Coxiella burnetii TaxID=777 RepID=UPI0021766818|nr:hypothetical protein [Coxiella burnetii]